LCLAITSVVVIGYPMEFWTYRTFRGYGLFASEIFTILGIPRPDDFDASHGIDVSGATPRWRYKEALIYHKKKYKLTD